MLTIPFDRLSIPFNRPKPRSVSVETEFSPRYRGVQINNILKFTPIMMLGNMVSATVIFPVAYNAGLASAFLFWCAPLLYVVFAAAQSRSRIVKAGYLRTASRRAVERAKVSALLLGSWWSRWRRK